MRPQLLFSLWGSAYWPPIWWAQVLLQLSIACLLGLMSLETPTPTRALAIRRNRQLSPYQLSLVTTPGLPREISQLIPPGRAIVIWRVPLPVSRPGAFCCQCTCCGRGARDRDPRGIHLFVTTTIRPGELFEYIRDELAWDSLASAPQEVAEENPAASPVQVTNVEDAVSLYLLFSACRENRGCPIPPQIHIWDP